LIQISLKVKKYQAKAEEFVSYKNKTKQKCKRILDIQINIISKY